MKIILRVDVENLGKLGDIVSVKAGFGRNYLLPQGMAMMATPGNLKVFEQERQKLQAKMDTLRGEADQLAARINGLVLVIPMRVGDNDKLYGSVTNGIIGDLLAKEGIEVDKRRILIDSIRTVGAHPARVRLHADVMAEFTVNVVSEDKMRHGESAAPAAQEEPAN